MLGWIDLAGLNGKSVMVNKGDAVLNGIAYDSAKAATPGSRACGDFRWTGPKCSGGTRKSE